MNRPAKRTYQINTRSKLGVRKAERCLNCQMCAKRVAHHEGRRGQPRKAVAKMAEVRIKHSVRGVYAESYLRKTTTNWNYWCTLMWAQVTKNDVCNFHIPTDTDISKKKVIKAQRKRMTKKRTALLEMADKTIREIAGGIPKRPVRPDTLEELRGTEVPAHMVEHIDTHWEALADELYRYHKELWYFRRRYVKLLVLMLEDDVQLRMMQEWFERPDLDEHELAVMKANEHGRRPPIWKWDEVLQKIKKAVVPSPRVPTGSTTEPGAVQPPQEDAPQGD